MPDAIPTSVVNIATGMAEKKPLRLQDTPSQLVLLLPLSGEGPAAGSWEPWAGDPSLGLGFQRWASESAECSRQAAPSTTVALKGISSDSHTGVSQKSSFPERCAERACQHRSWCHGAYLGLFRGMLLYWLLKHRGF